MLGVLQFRSNQINALIFVFLVCLSPLKRLGPSLQMGLFYLCNKEITGIYCYKSGTKPAYLTVSGLTTCRQISPITRM